MNEKEIESLTDKVLSSHKYKGLHPAVVERIINDLSGKYQGEVLEKKVKEKLHKIFGAFFVHLPDFKRLAKKFEKDLKEKGESFAVLNLLKYQTSTRERLPFYEDFYKEVFRITGKPKSILDLGCGFNPVFLALMNLAKDTEYLAVDIFKPEIDCLNKIFQILKYKNAKAVWGDAVSKNFGKFDVCLVLKFLPCLKEQNCSVQRFLDTTSCRWLVVSFPKTNLAGRRQKETEEKELSEFIESRNLRCKIIEFSNEKVFVIYKHHLEDVRSHLQGEMKRNEI